MELTAKDFTAQLAAKGYTPIMYLDVDNGEQPNTVQFTTAISFSSEDGIEDFRNIEEYHGITCEKYENLAFFTKTYPLTEKQVQEIEDGYDPGNTEQEEKFFEALRNALEEIGIDLDDIKVHSS